jgi:HSP20 family protein
MTSLFEREIDQLIENNFPIAEDDAALLTDSNLIETWGAYYVQVALPGIVAEELDIKVIARNLVITGRFHAPAIEGSNVVWRTILEGDFVRTFRLPAEVDPDSTEAKYAHGILTVSLRKMAHLKPATVKVAIED